MKTIKNLALLLVATVIGLNVSAQGSAAKTTPVAKTTTTASAAKTTPAAKVATTAKAPTKKSSHHKKHSVAKKSTK